jgi:hypothetical protein
MNVLFTYLTGTNEKNTYQVTNNDTTVVIPINKNLTDKFVKMHNVPVAEDGSYDSLGISQVMAQSIADTLYQALPDMKVKFIISGIEDVVDLVGLEECVSRYSFLPYFFGSKANYVGEYSYDDYVEYMATRGITLDAYSEDQQLKVVNSVLLSAMIVEDVQNGYTPAGVGEPTQQTEEVQPAETYENVQEVNNPT